MSRFGGNKNRDSSMDEEYWQQLASVIDGKKERVWDALIEGFDKYSQVLVERSSLIQETDGLKQQVNVVICYMYGHSMPVYSNNSTVKGSPRWASY